MSGTGLAAQGKRPSVRILLLALACILGIATLAACGYDYETGGGKPAPKVGLASSSSQEDSVSYVDGADAQPVVLDQQGWWAKDSFVHYGIKVRNPNSGYAACNTQVHVQLFDEAGNLANEATHTIGAVGPDATVGFTGTVGDGWAPSTVEIELVEGSTQWQTFDSYAEPFAVDDVEEHDMGEFRYELKGLVTNNSGDYVSTVYLHTLLLDEAGNIEAGYPAEAYKIKAGQEKSFIHTINSAPDHASVEVYAQANG